MFKVFGKPQRMTCREVSKQYPNLAYILINLSDRSLPNGVMIPPIGYLHAVCDKEGL